MPIKDTNIAYYLKYRPQSLNDLAGQEIVKKTLNLAFQNNKLSHAYLLAGPRGTGKTSTARILAKMVNCKGKNPPCNECSICLTITDGSNLDLIEIDAASNRGIEDIRALREKVKLSPTSGKKKVYIIDEVHMLTTEAFNALLKTLEEPPAHALFILATTDASKLPQTILSRVQRLDFKLATVNQLFETLEKIVKMEKIDIEEGALRLIAKSGEGSFRDAIKLLDQLSSLEKITLKSVEEDLKSTSFAAGLALLKNLASHDGKMGLSLVLELIKNGADTKDLIISLMDSLRNLVFIKNGLGEELVKPNQGVDKYQEFVNLAEIYSNKELIRQIEILQNAFEKLKFSTIPSLPLELAVVEICGEEISKTVENRELKVVVEDRELKMEEQKEIHPPPSTIKEPPSTIHHPPSNDDILKLKEKWTYVLETIRPYNFSLEALLRSINITGCTETTLIMEVPYSFHQRILEAPKNRDILESILSEILGRKIGVSTVLGNRPQRVEDVANIEVAADDEIIRAAAEIFNSDSIN